MACVAINFRLWHIDSCTPNIETKDVTAAASRLRPIGVSFHGKTPALQIDARLKASGVKPFGEQPFHALKRTLQVNVTIIP